MGDHCSFKLKSEIMDDLDLLPDDPEELIERLIALYGFQEAHQGEARAFLNLLREIFSVQS